MKKENAFYPTGSIWKSAEAKVSTQKARAPSPRIKPKPLLDYCLSCKINTFHRQALIHPQINLVYNTEDEAALLGNTWLFPVLDEVVVTEKNSQELIEELELQCGWTYQKQCFMQMYAEGRVGQKNPFILTDQILMPLTGSKNKSTSWLNLMQVQKLERCPITKMGIVHFRCGLVLELPYSYLMLKKNIEKTIVMAWHYYVNVFHQVYQHQDLENFSDFFKSKLAIKSLNTKNSVVKLQKESWQGCYKKGQRLSILMEDAKGLSLTEVMEEYDILPSRK